jgi:hypothetical protein
MGKDVGGRFATDDGRRSVSSNTGDLVLFGFVYGNNGLKRLAITFGEYRLSIGESRCISTCRND